MNVGNCVSLSFSRKRKPLRFNNGVDGSILKRVVEVRDLGVTLTGDLSRAIDISISLCLNDTKMVLKFRVSGRLRTILENLGAEAECSHIHETATPQSKKWRGVSRDQMRNLQQTLHESILRNRWRDL